MTLFPAEFKSGLLVHHLIVRVDRQNLFFNSRGPFVLSENP